MSTSANPDPKIDKQTTAVSMKEPHVETVEESIEEDDEFEEFEPAHWSTHDEDAEDDQQWMVGFFHL